MAGMAGHCWRFIGSYVYREGGRDGGGGKERGGERLVVDGGRKARE